MASSYTVNTSLEKPANGDDVDTWNVPVNGDWDIVDAVFGNTTTLTSTTGTATLTATQYRPRNIVVSATLTGDVTYNIPAGVGGTWSVFNNTTGAHLVKIGVVSGSTVTIPQGYRVFVVSDGTNATAGATGAIANFNVPGSLILTGSSTGYAGLKAAASSGTVTYTLPASDGTSGQSLTTNGSGTLSWSSVTSGVTSFSAGATGLTPNTGTTGAVTLAGTLAVANGGTGATTQGGAQSALNVPSTTGGGATGTWGINITGTAAATLAAAQTYANGIFNLSDPGYQVLPSGLTMQWGVATIFSGGQSVTLSFTFPGAFYGVLLTDQGTGAVAGSGQPTSLSDFAVYAQTYPYQCFWIAFGF